MSAHLASNREQSYQTYASVSVNDSEKIHGSPVDRICWMVTERWVFAIHTSALWIICLTLLDVVAIDCGDLVITVTRRVWINNIPRFGHVRDRHRIALVVLYEISDSIKIVQVQDRG